MIAISECRVTKYYEQGNTHWQDIYMMLRPLTRHIAYNYHVPAWRGQENDIAEDIMQETARRLFEYEQKIERGGAHPIHTLLPLVRVIAHNYAKDRRRQDMHLERIEAEDEKIEQFSFHDDKMSIEDYALENAYHEKLFTELAREIVHFPLKQKQALLIDLAAHMSFEQEPTPLQQAFLNVGIQLQAYQNLLPTIPQEQNRHTSLLAHAYRRISTLVCVNIYNEQDI